MNLQSLFAFLALQAVLIAFVVVSNPSLLTKPTAETLASAALSLGVYCVLNGVIAKRGRIRRIFFGPQTQQLVAILSLILCIATLGLNVGVGLYKKSTENWKPVDGTITKLDFQTKRGRKARSYYPLVTVAYNVDGKQYSSVGLSQKDFDAKFDPSESNLGAAESSYLPGKTMSVYYDPGNPNNMLLNPGLGDFELWVLEFGAALSLVGSILSIWGFLRPARIDGRG